MKRIARVLLEPASTFSVVKFWFLGNEHHSGSLNEFDERINSGATKIINSSHENLTNDPTATLYMYEISDSMRRD